MSRRELTDWLATVKNYVIKWFCPIFSIMKIFATSMYTINFTKKLALPRWQAINGR